MAKPATSHLSKFALSAASKIQLSTTVQCQIIVPNGAFLSAVNGGGIGGADSGSDATALRTDATSPGALGSFTLVVLDDMHFALRTADGFYITAVNGGGIGDTLLETGIHQPIVTNGTALDYSVFHLVPLTGKQVALRTQDDQHYVTAVNGGGFKGHGDVPIRTVAKKHGRNERFKLVLLGLFSKTKNGPN
jgi:hypothetical protein